MLKDPEKIKQILNKTFCFTELQVQDAIRRGREVMNKDDMIFLLSQERVQSKEFLHLEMIEYNSEKVFEAINKAKSKNFNGIVLNTTIPAIDDQKIREMGYFIHYDGYGSTSWDNIYLNEDTFLRSELSRFQNLFGSLEGIAHYLC